MVKTISQNKKLYLMTFIILALIAIGVVAGSFPTLAACALAVYCLTFFSINDGIVMIFAIMPFANIFKMTPKSMSLFTVLEILAVLLYVFKSGKIKFPPVFLLTSLFLYMMLLSIDSFQMVTLLKVVIGLFIIYIATLILKKKDIINIAYLYSISIAAMLLLCQIPEYGIIIENYMDDLNYYVDKTGVVSDILRNSGFLGDPNYCGIMLITALSFLCVLYYYNDIGNEFWIIGSTIASLGMLTYSKSYFLCLVALIVLLITLVLFRKHKVWAIIALIAMAILVSLSLNGKIEAVDMILSRFESGTDITTGRSKLNNEFLEYIFSNEKTLAFGEGITKDVFPGVSNNVHNIYIETLFKLGIVGTLLYLCTLFSMFNKPKKLTSQKNNIVNYIPVLFVLVMFGFLAGILNYATPFYLLLAYFGINYNRIYDTDN